MNREELKEVLRGERWDTVNGVSVPKDSISLDGLVSLLEGILGSDSNRIEIGPDGEMNALAEGVTKTSNGKYMKNGKFIQKSEAYVNYL